MKSANQIKTKPQQRTFYVVRAGESDTARAVYRGNDAAAARHVARATLNATVTFKTALSFDRYLNV